jgi:arabinogalactan oligomer/maltooligosaccharide transport system permease protein
VGVEMGFSIGKTVLKIFATVMGFTILFVMLYPVLFIIIQSITPEKGIILTSLTQVFEYGVTFENYLRAFQDPLFYSALVNSAVISFLTIVISIVVITPAAYSFSRFKFFGRDTLLYVYLILSQVGGGFGIIAVIALFMFLVILNSWGIPIFNMWVLPFIYASGAVPFQTWLIKTYFDNLPKELDEAAFMDGASWSQIVFKIVLPASRSAMVIITLFSFMGAWGEFFVANLLRVQTLGAYIFQTAIGPRGEQAPSLFASLALIYAIPVILVYIFAQRYIGEAYRMGAVKG